MAPGLWVSDGTLEGTRSLGGAELPELTVELALGEMEVVGNRIYYRATDPVHGTELWALE